MKNHRFFREFEVHYHEVNSFGEATPATMLHYLEDVAISHSDAVGFGIDRLKVEGMAWVLNRWHVQMDRYPRYGEKIVIETWPSSYDRFYATREFLLRDQENRIIGRATSLWIYINTETKRPLRIPAEMQNYFGIDSMRAVNDSFESLKSDGESEYELSFSVRRSDIDTNGHVNNAKYLLWTLEVIPEDIYKMNHLFSFEIVYKKETSYGSAILSKCFVDDNDRTRATFRHVIMGNDTKNELAIARTVWSRRDD